MTGRQAKPTLSTVPLVRWQSNPGDRRASLSNSRPASDSNAQKSQGRLQEPQSLPTELPCTGFTIQYSNFGMFNIFYHACMHHDLANIMSQRCLTRARSSYSPWEPPTFHIPHGYLHEISTTDSKSFLPAFDGVSSLPSIRYSDVIQASHPHSKSQSFLSLETLV